ncbi:MAG: transporter, family, tetracycline resistance protein [Candidatus Parcubacteria bacterium]|nr:transporter, family, tetracycline resistance protein [Candidatus Parcubacteria bacterium]
MEEQSSNLKWWILLTVIIGTFLGRLDQTIVNLALPKIINDFSISVSAAGWIATAYILANAVFVPIWGKLGDTIGRKKVYILGFGMFIVGSVLAGLAWNLSSMIVFRVVQAIAGSADYPTAMAIIAVTFKGAKERAQALGIWSSSFAAASVFGPLIGGPLIDNFGWRSVFFINIPVGIVGILMALAFIHESRAEGQATHYFDWWGALSLGGTLSALVLVLDQGPEWGWLSGASILCYALIVALFWIFIEIERRVSEPIVDLKFFKIPAFVNTLGNNFIVFMGMMGGLFLIPIFAQSFLGDNATQAGYLFMPMAAALMLAAPLGGSLIGRVQARYVIFASTLVAGIGIFFFSFLDARSTAWSIMWPLCIMAFGMGFGMAQRTNIIASVVDQNEIGIASSILALARNVAGAFGIALFGTILNNRIESNILRINAQSWVHSNVPADISSYIALVISKAQIDAYDYVFVLSSVIVIVGSFFILTMKVGKERSDVTVHVE